MTNLDLLLETLPIWVAVIGWPIGYYLSKQIDKQSKKKEIRVSYLITAWNLLECASCRKDTKLNYKIEEAIAVIQLLGTEKQIELAQAFAKEIAENGDASANRLLNVLRDDLRDELSIKKTSKPFKFLRFKN